MSTNNLKHIRRLLWIYFLLLIFEGALRRWIFPGFSTPLLLVRDPVALLVLIKAWPLITHRPLWRWVQPLLLVSSIALIFAILAGHGDLLTAIYGTRILVLHLPLIFIYSAVFNRDDVIRFLWVILCLSIPMTILITAQSNLPEIHLLNVGTGGVGTAVFDGAEGRFRPPGTFSFISGVSQFFTLSIASLFGVFYGSRVLLKGKILCAMACVALIVALPVSISRWLLAGYIQVAVALAFFLVFSRARIVPLLSGVFVLCVAFFIASSTPAFRESIGAFTARWEIAALAEAKNTDTFFTSSLGVFQLRVLDDILSPLQGGGTAPLLGRGIGIGTNVGAQRLTNGFVFLVGEGSWASSIAELGLPLGLVFIYWRCSLAWLILRLSVREAYDNNALPLVLSGASLLFVLVGQLGQPTGLGFIVFSAGITLASCTRSRAY